MGHTQPIRTWQCEILNLRPPANGGGVRFQLFSFQTGTEGPGNPWRGYEVKIYTLFLHSRRWTIDSTGKTGSVKSDWPEGERSSSYGGITDGERSRAGGCVWGYQAWEIHSGSRWQSHSPRSGTSPI